MKVDSIDPIRAAFLVLAVIWSIFVAYSRLAEIVVIGESRDKEAQAALGVEIHDINLKLRRQSFEGIARYELWGMEAPQESELDRMKAGQEDLPVYEKKEINGVPCLQLKGNDKYRWEFYGLFKSGNVSKAILYNPALSQSDFFGWLQSVPGEKIDRDLRVKEIDRSYIVIRSEKGRVDFKLELFRVGSHEQ